MLAHIALLPPRRRAIAIRYPQHMASQELLSVSEVREEGARFAIAGGEEDFSCGDEEDLSRRLARAVRQG